MPRRDRKRHATFAALASRALAAPLVAMAMLAGCASTPAPSGDLAAAESALASARAAGAADYAPVEFGFAQSKLDAARAAMAARKHADAASAARQAEVDAQLALAKSEAARLRREVGERSEANAQLRRDLLGEDSP